MRIWRYLFPYCLSLLVLSPPCFAHEFWLEPDNFRTAPSKNISISIRIGQNFKGESWPFIQDSFYKFGYHLNGLNRQITGLDGDDPAANLTLKSEGLAIITHHTKPIDIVFNDWKIFTTYLDSEGLNSLVSEHVRLGFPKSKIKELYSRCAKLLVQVGEVPGGQDIFTGMPLEIIAEKNPYQLKAKEKLPITLMFHGRPLEGAQIIKISKKTGLRVKGPRTDQSGRAWVEIPNSGPWLLNAVHIIAHKPLRDAHWFSYWASLTFDKIKAN
ncbi:MAG: DUF4198 domain-containing protein [Rhodospirillaceae bacterium]